MHEAMNKWGRSDEIAAIAAFAGFLQFIALIATILVIRRSAHQQLRAYICGRKF
jgi:hypothetical protein